MPKLAAAALILMLAALATTLSYAGYLVVGVVAGHLGTGRFLAGLLLGCVFARLPVISQGKLRTVGLLPANARQPVMFALLAFCLLSFLYRGELVSALFTGFAAGFLLTFRWIRGMLVKRLFSSFFPPSAPPSGPAAPASRREADDTVIDVEFREKKDD